MTKEEKQETRKCPHCDTNISVRAKVCPNCQKDLRGFPNRHPFLTCFVILFVIPFFIIFAWLSSSHGDNKQVNTSASPSNKTEFNAYVNFTGSEFVISNLDEHTCQNARMKVNSDYSLDGYNLESALDSTVKTGEAAVYKVGAAQFTKGDGTRFNPYSTKPKNFSIGCRGSNELNGGFWYGEF